MTMSTFTGEALASALAEQPAIQLSFYSYGVMLRKQEGSKVSEYPVDPVAIATALAAEVSFSTGILSGNTLLVTQHGMKRTVIDYRPPQKTGIFLDGSETPILVPLPGMIMALQTTETSVLKQIVYAVTERPTANTPLFHVPLPNVYQAGNICWGTVKRELTVEAMWKQFLGSSFGSHAIHGKSKMYPDDIRKKLLALEKRKSRVYPKTDLVPAKMTFGKLIEGES